MFKNSEDHTLSLAVCSFKINGDVVPNGLDRDISSASQGLGELNFEEDEDDQQFYMKDLPDHACK